MLRIKEAPVDVQMHWLEADELGVVVGQTNDGYPFGRRRGA
ncbi:MAG: hypothetical protein OXI74_05795 [Rhodospirillaceae bacterium]|nr:hypothetical protein [Rhodospirillaceae bacterium]